MAAAKEQDHRMATFGSRRLEQVLGAPVDGLTLDLLRGLPTRQVREDYDLDFKETLYADSDKAKRDLCSDVAAMANTAGGLIILGVREGVGSVAQDVPGVDLSTGERDRMHQIIGVGVSPFLAVDILAIADQDEPNHGLYVIAVPSSPGAPHAVRHNNSWTFPRRNGATSIFLSEADVAAAYRRRFTTANEQSNRLDAVESDAIARLDRSEMWIVIALVPDLPGSMTITQDVFTAFSAEVRARPAMLAYGSAFMDTTVRRQRLLATGDSTSAAVKFCSLELSTDGAGVFAHDLPSLGGGGLERFGGNAVPAGEQTVAVAILSGLGWVAHHARDRTGASGNAIVRVTLLPANGPSGMVLALPDSSCGQRTRSTTSIRWGSVATAEIAAAIDDLAQAADALVAAAWRLLTDLGQAFGIVTMDYFTAEGEIRLAAFNQHWQQALSPWAKAHNIATT